MVNRKGGFVSRKLQQQEYEEEEGISTITPSMADSDMSLSSASPTVTALTTAIEPSQSPTGLKLGSSSGGPTIEPTSVATTTADTATLSTLLENTFEPSFTSDMQTFNPSLSESMAGSSGLIEGAGGGADGNENHMGSSTSTDYTESMPPTSQATTESSGPSSLVSASPISSSTIFPSSASTSSISPSSIWPTIATANPTGDSSEFGSDENSNSHSPDDSIHSPEEISSSPHPSKDNALSVVPSFSPTIVITALPSTETTTAVTDASSFSSSSFTPTNAITFADSTLEPTPLATISSTTYETTDNPTIQDNYISEEGNHGVDTETTGSPATAFTSLPSSKPPTASPSSKPSLRPTPEPSTTISVAPTTMPTRSPTQGPTNSNAALPDDDAGATAATTEAPTTTSASTLTYTEDVKLLRIFSAWQISNTLQFTADMLGSGPDRTGLEEAYEEMVQEVALQQQQRKLRTRYLSRDSHHPYDRGLQVLEVAFNQSSPQIIQVKDSECPTTAVEDKNIKCQTVHGAFDLLLGSTRTGDHESESEFESILYSQYSNATQLAIEEGKLQEKLDYVDEASILVVEQAIPVDPSIVQSFAPSSSSSFAALHLPGATLSPGTSHNKVSSGENVHNSIMTRTMALVYSIAFCGTVVLTLAAFFVFRHVRLERQDKSDSADHKDSKQLEERFLPCLDRRTTMDEFLSSSDGTGGSNPEVESLLEEGNRENDKDFLEYPVATNRNDDGSRRYPTDFSEKVRFASRAQAFGAEDDEDETNDSGVFWEDNDDDDSSVEWSETSSYVSGCSAAENETDKTHGNMAKIVAC